MLRFVVANIKIDFDPAIVFEASVGFFFLKENIIII
jgi:hypothetical protein